MTDKKTIHIFSVSLLAALLLALCLPLGESGRIVAAILLLPAAILIPLFLKKRNILSVNNDVNMIKSGWWAAGLGEAGSRWEQQAGVPGPTGLRVPLQLQTSA